MYCARINQVRKSHLMNAAETLVKRMRDNVEYQGVIDSDESINGIVNDLLFVHPSGFYVNPLSDDRVSG